MKTSNLDQPGERAQGIVRGHISPRRAGSGGLPELTDGPTTVEDVDSLRAYGGDVHEYPDNAGLLSYHGLVAWLTNASGGVLEAGATVIVDPATDTAVTTTTSAQNTVKVGIVLDEIADGDVGPVTVEGYAPFVTTTASVTRGHYLETSTTAGKATANSTRRAGSFGQLVTGGSTGNAAILFGSPDSSLATLAPTTFTFPGATSPAQTSEGSAVWDTDDDVLTVGDGSSRKTFGYVGTSAPSGGYGTAASGSSKEVLRTDAVLPKPTEADLSLADNTTNNVSTTKHGFAPKAPNDATKFLNGVGGYTSPAAVVGGASVGYGLLAYQLGYPVTTGAPGANTVTLAAVSGGSGGALAIPIFVHSTMNLDSYVVWQTATANARAAEARLYLDNGTNTADFVAGTDTTWSFTPSAADARTSATVSGAPVQLAPGIYWLVIRNTSSSQSFLIGRVAGGSIIATKGGSRTKSIAALSSTLDLSTGWSTALAASAPISAMMQGRALGESGPS